MIEPPSRNSGRAFCTVKNSPFTFTSKVWSKCASVAASSGAMACRARVGEENVDVTVRLFHDGVKPVQVVQPRHIADDGRDVSADERGGLRQFFLAAPGDDGMRAFFDEALGRGQADPAAAACDDGDLAFKLFHDHIPSGDALIRLERRGSSASTWDIAPLRTRI